MKKSEQIKINEQVLGVYKEVYNTIRYADEIEWKRLRTCQARVTLIGKFSVLQSYDTVIAVINNTTDTLYDFFTLCIRLYVDICTTYSEIQS